MGRMLAIMIIQGGQPPQLMTPTLVDAVLGEDEGDPLDDIIDNEKSISLNNVSYY